MERRKEEIERERKKEKKKERRKESKRQTVQCLQSTNCIKVKEAGAHTGDCAAHLVICHADDRPQEKVGDMCLHAVYLQFLHDAKCRVKKLSALV